MNAIASQMHVLIAQEMLGTTRGVEELIESNIAPGRRAARGRASPLGTAGRGGRQCDLRAKQQGMDDQTALESSHQLDELIESMNWNLFKAPGGNAFISSDNPVVINAHSDARSGRRVIDRRR